MNSLAPAIVGFGDLAVLLPLILLISVWLAALRQPRVLGWWLVAVLLCMGVIAVLKVYFYVCPPLPDLRSPSGGASLSTLVYGALAVIAGSALGDDRALMVFAIGAAAIVTIFLAIVFGGVHSFPETMLGTAIGLAALWLFSTQYLDVVRAPSRFTLLIVAGSLLVAVLLNGHDLSTEDFLHKFASAHVGILGCTL